MTDLLQDAYDPERFRKQGHELVDLLADYLKVSSQDIYTKVNPWMEPDEALEYWKSDLASANEQAPIDLFRKLVNQSVHLHHPHYMGHQIAPPAPIAALGGLFADVLNNGMGVYEMGIASTAIEQLIIKEMAKRFGYDEEPGGFLTSGGTLANLTALLAARSHKASEAVWENGSTKALAIMVSAEAHYCVDRAARIMGWGSAGVIKIPVNEHLQMDTTHLTSALEKAKKEGIEVIAVVGSACSTSTGSYDDLVAIGDFCDKHQLWFHVDGAHGAVATFSKRYEHLVKGIEKADSIVMDFHKMLMTPAIVTGLFFKKESQSYQTFSQKAQYLWKQSENEEWYNLAKRTFECTKLMMSVKVYSVIRTHGWQLYDDFVTTLYDLGKSFAQLLEKRKDFELAIDPACNIVCFRYGPTDLPKEEWNELNKMIRQHILEEGRYYIVQTMLNDQLFLRTTLTNPFTTVAHLEGLLDQIVDISTRSTLKL